MLWLLFYHWLWWGDFIDISFCSAAGQTITVSSISIISVILFITLFQGSSREVVESFKATWVYLCPTFWILSLLPFLCFVSIYWVWQILYRYRECDRKVLFLLTAVLSSVHTALSVKCIQEQREFFKMRFSFFYGLDTRREREEKRTCWEKKKKCCWSLSSFVSCFISLSPWKPLLVRCSIFLHLGGWENWMPVSVPMLIAFYFCTQVAYPDQCVHMTGDAIWQALPSSFTLFLFLFCSVSKRPVVQRWQTRWKSGSPF